VLGVAGAHSITAGLRSLDHRRLQLLASMNTPLLI
jgi:hypothetical protein